MTKLNRGGFLRAAVRGAGAMLATPSLGQIAQGQVNELRIGAPAQDVGKRGLNTSSPMGMNPPIIQSVVDELNAAEAETYHGAAKHLRIEPRLMWLHSVSPAWRVVRSNEIHRERMSVLTTLRERLRKMWEDPAIAGMQAVKKMAAGLIDEIDR